MLDMFIRITPFAALKLIPAFSRAAPSVFPSHIRSMNSCLFSLVRAFASWAHSSSHVGFGPSLILVWNVFAARPAVSVRGWGPAGVCLPASWLIAACAQSLFPAPGAGLKRASSIERVGGLEYGRAITIPSASGIFAHQEHRFGIDGFNWVVHIAVRTGWCAALCHWDRGFRFFAHVSNNCWVLAISSTMFISQRKL